MSEPIRLLLLDDHELFRESVARLLQAEPGFEVVAACGTIPEALGRLAGVAVDVVLLDLDLGLEMGTDFLEQVGRTPFAGKILLVTAGVNPNEILGLIRRGIAGIFLKHGSPADLVQGIRDTVAGKVLFDQDLLRRALAPAPARQEPGHAALTEREREVLAWVFEGLSNKQIGARLDSSETAVKAIMQQLFGKTGVRSRGQLVRVALERYPGDLRPGG